MKNKNKFNFGQVVSHFHFHICLDLGGDVIYDISFCCCVWRYVVEVRSGLVLLSAFTC